VVGPLGKQPQIILDTFLQLHKQIVSVGIAETQRRGVSSGKKESPTLTSAESSQALLPCANVANSSLSPDPSLLHVGSACCLYVLWVRSRRFVFFLFRTESCDWRATTHGSIGSFVCPVPV
jgi:hypothetical protein